MTSRTYAEARRRKAAPQLLAACEAIVAYSDRCLVDPLNPCFDNRPTDVAGQHWGAGEACPVCQARAAVAATVETVAP